MPRLEGGPTVDANEIFLPERDAASTHILKPENEKDYPGSAESEAWAMMAAGKAARCARVALLSCDNALVTLVVERHDRLGSNWPDAVSGLHQEDACQALGMDPLNKHASTRKIKGCDPTYIAIARLLALHASDPLPEVKELL